MPINPSAIVEGSGTITKLKSSIQELLAPPVGVTLTLIGNTCMYDIGMEEGAVNTPVSKGIHVFRTLLESIWFENMATPGPDSTVPKFCVVVPVTLKKEAWTPIKPVIGLLVIKPQAVSSNCVPAVKATLLMVSKAPRPFPPGSLADFVPV